MAEQQWAVQNDCETFACPTITINHWMGKPIQRDPPPLEK